VDVDQHTRRQQRQNPVSRKSTLVPGVRTWLPSMLSMSPAASPANGASRASCTVDRMISMRSQRVSRASDARRPPPLVRTNGSSVPTSLRPANSAGARA
jgi:hypothetical protein